MSWVNVEIERVRRGETTCLDLSLPFYIRDEPVHRLTEFPGEILSLENLTELDLSNHALAAIPEDIKRLQRLKKLSLAGNRMVALPKSFAEMPVLIDLDLAKTDFYRTASRQYLPPGLSSLNLSNNDSLTDGRALEALRGCKHLRELGVIASGVDLNQLKTVAPDLQILRVGGSRTKFTRADLRALAGWDDLKELSLMCGAMPADQLELLCGLQDLAIFFGEDDLRGDALDAIRTDPDIWLKFGSLKRLSLYVSGGSHQNMPRENITWIDVPRDLNALALTGGMLPAGFPGCLEKMHSLQSLTLRNCALATVPPQIFELPKLSSLVLLDDDIGSVPREIGRLQELRELNLAGNPIHSLPEEIGALTQLTSLWLANTQLGTLPARLANLKSLTSLSLHGNPLHNCPPQIFALSGLHELVLSRTGLAQIPDRIEALERLTTLRLEGNNIREIPTSVVNLRRLRYLSVDAKDIVQPPAEIVARGIAAIQSYFVELADSAVRLLEAKLIVVGEGEVGKSSLAQKLIDPAFDLAKNGNHIESTRGIAIAPWTWRTPAGEDFKVNVWDFGGQEIYHSTHQFFLTKRSLYVFVWDARKEDRLAGFDYWLSVVRLLSANSPIVIVLNKADERIKEIEQRSLTEKFKNIVCFHKVSVLTGAGMAALTTDIHAALLKLPHVGDLWPTRWNSVRMALQNDTREYIDREEYLAICSAKGLNEEQALVLSNYLHDLGVILHFQDDPLLQQIVILKPEWGTDAVYAVLDTKAVQRSRGRFDLGALRAIWSRTRYPASRHPELLQLMMRFELCFPLGRTGSYVAPELLAEEAPDFPWRSTDNLCFEYRYEFMPAGILPRLIARMHGSIEEDFFWKNGLLVRAGETRASVIAEPLNRRIKVAVMGVAKQDLLSVVRHEMAQIHKTLNAPDVAEMIPCICDTCRTGNTFFYDYQLLFRYYSNGIASIVCNQSLQPVPVEALLTGALPFGELRNNLLWAQAAPGVSGPIVINNIIEGAQMKPKKEDAPQVIRSPWAAGSFYLVVFATVLGALGAAARLFSFSVLLVLIVGGVLLTTLIGALQLRQDDRLSEKNFLSLMKLAFQQLPLLSKIAAPRPGTDPAKTAKP
jgi:internalin A